jgi:hypothetical protein
MMKRKPPVALITVLVVAVAGLVIAAKPFGIYSKSPEEQAKIMQKEMEDAMRAREQKDPDMKKVNTDAEAAKLRANLKIASGGPAKEGAEGDPEDTSPSVVLPEQVDYKPVPNEAATSSQWYDKK